jgi:hypothetical protein
LADIQQVPAGYHREKTPQKNNPKKKKKTNDDLDDFSCKLG